MHCNGERQFSTSCDNSSTLCETNLPPQFIHSTVDKSRSPLGHSRVVLSHSVSTDGDGTHHRTPITGNSSSHCASLPPVLGPQSLTSLHVGSTAPFVMPKIEYSSEPKPSSRALTIDSATRRARYGQHRRANTMTPTSSNACSLYLVNETRRSNQDLSSSSDSNVRKVSSPVVLSSLLQRPPATTASALKEPIIITTSEHEQCRGAKKRFLLKKQVSEDITRGENAHKQKNHQCLLSSGVEKYSRENKQIFLQKVQLKLGVTSCC